MPEKKVSNLHCPETKLMCVCGEMKRTDKTETRTEGQRYVQHVPTQVKNRILYQTKDTFKEQQIGKSKNKRNM